MDKEFFLANYRHSLAHVLAKAVIELWGKDVQYAIGPQVDDGFYYDFKFERAFTPEGTLKAAAEKLPYLKDLGVTIAYLVPVMKMDTDMDKGFWSPRQIKSGFDNPKNQYRISDYFHVDEEYGTDADLRDFCAEAHGIGRRLYSTSYISTAVRLRPS